MLSFEVAPQKILEELEVYLTSSDLISLMQQLQFLAEGRTDHVHLMAIGWGGSDLSDTPFRRGNTPLKHVKINLV